LAANPESRALEHAEWLGLLVDQEATLRQQKRFEARTRTAKLRQSATVEDVDFRTPRGLDRTLFLRLASCDWVREHRHCLITGPCGTGKTFIACALGDKACRDNLSVLYQRSSRLFGALALARGDGRYARLIRQLARVNLLILDDWGPEPLNAEQRRDLLEIVEDRYNCGSMVITSQVPVERWYETTLSSTEWSTTRIGSNSKVKPGANGLLPLDPDCLPMTSPKPTCGDDLPGCHQVGMVAGIRLE
jgi:DNA replication protein DnaC